MKSHGSKMVAPIVIAILLIAYLCLYFCVIIRLDISVLAKVALAIIPLALAGVSIYVTAERIKEIRSGIEDDLGKY